jgi:hypothetical protein
MLVMMAGGAPTCPYAPVAKFLVPEWGDIVDSDIGLLHRPARLYTQAGGPVRQPCAGIDYIPQSGIERFACGGGSVFSVDGDGNLRQHEHSSSLFSLRNQAWSEKNRAR